MLCGNPSLESCFGDIPAGYRAMDDRTALKVLIEP
jgi:hypothetical protein